MIISPVEFVPFLVTDVHRGKSALVDRSGEIPPVIVSLTYPTQPQ